MFCPSCGIHLAVSSLVQRNVVMMGSTVVEYDARCPRCRQLIGKVSWGKFNPDPSLTKSGGDLPDMSEDSGELVPPPETRGSARRGAAGDSLSQAASKDERESTPEAIHCPCCGQVWPEGVPLPEGWGKPE